MEIATENPRPARFSRMKPDLPFDREDANRYLPWVIAVITCLAACLLTAGMWLGSVLLAGGHDLSGMAQVQLPAIEGQDTEAFEKTLRNAQGVDSVRRIESERLRELLNPWLGGGEAFDHLPIPVTFEVQLASGYNADKLRKALHKDFPGAVVGDYATWMADFQRALDGLRHAFYLLALMLSGAALAVVALVTRASIQLHFPIVRLLHRMGAEDAYVARQFRHNAFIQTLKGGFIGVAAAIPLLGLLRLFLGGMETPLLPQTGFSPACIGALLLLPLALSLCVALVSGQSAVAMLRRLH